MSEKKVFQEDHPLGSPNLCLASFVLNETAIGVPAFGQDTSNMSLYIVSEIISSDESPEMKLRS